MVRLSFRITPRIAHHESFHSLAGRRAGLAHAEPDARVPRQGRRVCGSQEVRHERARQRAPRARHAAVHVKQIQIASDNAKFGVARLAGVDAPKFEDNEKTLDELRARIKKTIDFIKSVPASAFEGGEDRDIKIVVPNRTFEMKGLTYLRGWVLPNVLFHVTTAYLILRHNGVDVGKRDFLGDVK